MDGSKKGGFMWYLLYSKLANVRTLATLREKQQRGQLIRVPNLGLLAMIGQQHLLLEQCVAR